MASNFPSRKGEDSAEVGLPVDVVLGSLRTTIDQWDFYNPLAEELNSEFSLQIVHWVLENFGQKDSSGEYFLFPDSDGFAGEELPDAIKQLVISCWGNELLVSGENKVWLSSQHVYVEDEPEIPGWQEIREQFTTIQEIIDFVKGNPEIIANIKQRKVTVMPQASLRYEPYFSHGWGLEFLISRLGIKVAPYGRDGKTWTATEYVLHNFDKGIRLAETVCDLALLAAQHSSIKRRELEPDCLEHLQRRLDGDEPVPICAGSFKPNAANAIVDLVIRKVI